MKGLKLNEEAKEKYWEIFLELELTKLNTKLEVLQEKLNTKEAEKEVLKERVNFLNERIIFLDVEKLRARGAMTARGILEQALSYAHKEIWPASTFPKAKFNCSDTIEKIGQMVEDNNTPNLPDTLILYNIFKECNLSTSQKARELYNTLSKDIHGSPWFESSISIVKERLSPDEFCAVSRIATDVFRLKIATITLAENAAIP